MTLPIKRAGFAVGMILLALACRILRVCFTPRAMLLWFDTQTHVSFYSTRQEGVDAWAAAIHGGEGFSPAHNE